MLNKLFDKVIILTQDYYPQVGGITTWCYEVARTLEAKGINVLIITKSFDGCTYTNEFTKDEKGINILRLNHEKWKNYRNERVYKAIKPLISPNTVFLCANWKMGVPCMLASLRRDIDYIVTVHGLDAIESRIVNKYLQKNTLKRSKGIISVSSFTADLLVRQNAGKLPEVAVINNGVDVKRFHHTGRQPEIEKKYGLHDGIRVISLGRLIPRKGFDTTIMAMDKLRDLNLHLYIAGSGSYEERLRELVTETNLEERVHFLGFIPDEDIAGLYNCCDIYSMPSRQLRGDVEGFGITYIEAAACGLPSIGGRNSGATDAIVHGETGILVEQGSIPEVAEAIRRLAENEVERKQLGKNALNRTRELFTWEYITDSIFDFINTACNRE
jgi:phosphatidylinositol alpha-1,6-mannosyltransferase